MKFQTKANSILTLALCFGLAACGNKAGDVAQKVLGGDVHTAAAEAAFTTGSWKSVCEATQFGNLGLGGEEIEYTVHQDGTFTKATTVYQEGNCQTTQFLILESGSFGNFNAVADSVYTIDETFNTVQVTPLNDAIAQKMNVLTGFCNINSWVSGAQQDVTANSAVVTCAGITKTPRVDYDLINITGNNNSTMFVGQTDAAHDKSSPQKRPAAINRNVSYVH
jgi:hypothetical protein